MFHCRRMDYVVNASKRLLQAWQIANVAHKVPDLRVLSRGKKITGHVDVLLLVAAEDDQPLRRVVAQQYLGTFPAE
jgi:hypothetical protein